MKAEVPFYLSACSSASLVVDHGDVKEFTTKVLKWWALADKSKFPAWAVAARIVFSFTPNSAACERVFSLLKFIFGDQVGRAWGLHPGGTDAQVQRACSWLNLDQFNPGASVTRDSESPRHRGG